MGELEKEVLELVCKVIKRDPGSIDPNADMFKEYHVDSLLGIEILAAMDKKYNVDLPEDRIKDIRTINQIIISVKDKLAGKK